MSLNLRQAKTGFTRKRIIDNEQVPFKHPSYPFPTEWIQKESWHWEEPSLDQIYTILKNARLSPHRITLACQRFLEFNKWTARNSETVAEEKTLVFIGDADDKIPGIEKFFHPTDSIDRRVEVLRNFIPALQDVGLVAFLTSSAYWSGKKNREKNLGLGFVCLLDRDYSPQECREWSKSVGLDESVMNQEHVFFIQPAEMIQTDRLEIPGPDIKLFEGGRLSLPVIVDAPRSQPPKNPISITLSEEDEERYAEILEKGKNGDLNGQRWKFFVNEIGRENWRKCGETEGLLAVLEQISGGHNVRAIDRSRKNNNRKNFIQDDFAAIGVEVKKINLVDLAEFDIEELETGNSYIFRSGPGSSKTKGIINRAIEHFGWDRVLYVSSLKGTIRPFCNKVPGFAYYLAGGEAAEQKRIFIPKQQKLAITEKSLRYLLDHEDSFEPFDAVIVDESERVFGNAPDRSSQQDLLHQLLKEAKVEIYLDADASAPITGWSARQSGKKVTCYVNEFDRMSEGHNVTFYKTRERAYEKMIELAKSGAKLFVPVGFKDALEDRTRIRELVSLLESEGIQTKGFDATTVPTELRDNPNQWITSEIDRGLQVLIVSPMFVIGWDYLPENQDKKYLFDATVGIFSNGVKNGQDIAQAIRRPRLTKEHHLFVMPSTGEQGHYGFYDEVERDTSKTRKRMKRNHAEELELRVRKREDSIKKNILYHTKLIFEERGASVKFDISEPSQGISKKIRQLRSENTEEAMRKAFEDDGVRQMMAQSVTGLDVAALTQEEYSDLWIRYQRLEKNRASLWKLASISGKTPDQRAWTDMEDGRDYNVLSGELLDELDKAIGLVPCGLIEFIASPRKEMLFQLDIERAEQLRKVLRDLYPLARYWLPWLKKSQVTERQVKKQAEGEPRTPSPIIFIKKYVESFDLTVEQYAQTNSESNLTSAKKALLAEYQKLRRQRKGVSNIKKRYSESYQILLDRVRAGEDLSDAEIERLAREPDLYVIRKPRIMFDEITEIASVHNRLEEDGSRKEEIWENVR